MRIAKVVGNIIATIKKPELDKYKMLLVKPISDVEDIDEESSLLVAIDTIGVSIDDLVVVVEGSRVEIVASNVPADAAIIAIIEVINKS